MKRLQAYLPITSVFGLALIVRMIYNVVVAKDYYPLHDSAVYQTIAFNILQEHCYCLLPHLPTVDRAPLWPAIIAAIYGVLGPHDHYVRLFLCFVGAGTCTLIYLFAKDLFGRRIALFAGLLAAIYPFLYIYDGWLYSESVYIFLLLAFTYALYRLQRNPNWQWMLLSGILLGLASLERPNGLIILASFLAWAVVIGWAKVLSWPAAAKSAIIIGVVSTLLFIPWTIRNYEVTHALVPVAVGNGKVMLGAYNDMILERPQYYGIWIIPTESTPAIAAQFPANCAGACEVQRDSTYQKDAIKWIESHLSDMPLLLRLHFTNLWSITTQEADLPINRFPDRLSSKLVVDMMEVITPIVFALAALGLVLTRKRWRELLFIYLMIVITVIQALVFYGIPRFRAPIEPMLILLAAGALWGIGKLIEQQRKGQATEQDKKEVQVATPASTAFLRPVAPDL
ncbi:MAG TPA: glycosyltransferase family 39 protein [Ktedonobacteraceae bacterium]|nr:glycosyltransferase family 39 protein [Ktedonobacteraceae bacterium]